MHLLQQRIKTLAQNIFTLSQLLIPVGFSYCPSSSRQSAAEPSRLPVPVSGTPCRKKSGRRRHSWSFAYALRLGSSGNQSQTYLSDLHISLFRQISAEKAALTLLTFLFHFANLEVALLLRYFDDGDDGGDDDGGGGDRWSVDIRLHRFDIRWSGTQNTMEPITVTCFCCLLQQLLLAISKISHEFTFPCTGHVSFQTFMFCTVVQRHV